MKSKNFYPPEDIRVAQLIDANLDRAREGLRVIEDWCRFGLNREDLVIPLKDWRQQLGRLHKTTYKEARNTSTDKGLGLSHPAQQQRVQPAQVVAANCARAQEALRVLEEFARKFDHELAIVSSSIRYDLYELEIKALEATNQSDRRKKLQTCHLCLVTTEKPSLLEIVHKALDVGIGMVQYRSKSKTDSQMLVQAKKIAALCQKYGAIFIVNDRIDLALASEADGVHLGQDDMPTSTARRLIGIDRLIGRSTRSLEQLQQAENEGCDYLGVGPINITNTKPHLKPIGLNYLKEACKSAKLPWFAIGGINVSNVEAIRRAGARRIAVSEGIMNANDPGSSTMQLLEGMK